MRPILEILSDGRERTPGELRGIIADRFALSDEERSPPPAQRDWRLFANRVAWALTYLHHAGATERVRRAVYKISERGRRFLAEYPDPVSLFRALEQLPEITAFRAGSNKSERGPAQLVVAVDTEVPPIERLGDAQAEFDDALAGDLLERIRESDPTFFEHLVLKLLVVMGYGGSEEQAAEHLGGGGDEGVDGVINEDKLVWIGSTFRQSG